MEQPAGFVQDSALVCRLKKSLYGLKQALRAWYEKMDTFLLSIDFVQCSSNPTVYIWQHGANITILVLYVDDLLLTGTSRSRIQVVQQALSERFEMANLGLAHYFLGFK